MDEEVGTADIGGARKQPGTLSIPPPPMPQMRDLVKGKGAAPLAAPTKVPLEEDPDTALTRWL